MKIKNNGFLWLTMVVVVTACVIPSAVSPAPTLAPGAVNTFIVQTAAAAATQTARVLPTISPTPTSTPTRSTASPTPTVTQTFIFLLPGSTSSLPAPTLAGIGNGTTSSDYACSIFSTEPPNNTVLAPRTDFTASWGVKNIGRNDWFRATMDYVYVSGDKLHEVSSYDLPKGVETGKNVFLPVAMETFRDRGTYSTLWALVVDDIYFCRLTLTVIVQ